MDRFFAALPTIEDEYRCSADDAHVSDDSLMAGNVRLCARIRIHYFDIASHCGYIEKLSLPHRSHYFLSRAIIVIIVATDTFETTMFLLYYVDLTTQYLNSNLPATSMRLEEMLLSDPLWTTVLAVSAVYVLIVASQSSSSASSDDGTKKKGKQGHSEIPWAPGWIPFLGHALSYRRDPAGFLVRSCQSVGRSSIFQVNLAGKHMIVVAGADAQRQVARAPERILSARQAVADIGFEETLGRLNVHQGTDLHKGIVKGIWQPNSRAAEQFLGWKTALRAALQVELRGNQEDEDHSNTTKVELFHLLRRVMLRATVDRMIGPTFLQNGTKDDPFLKEFMEFQDELEDVTAKAVVMPRWYAVPTLLWPVRRKRELLQAQIAERLDDLLHNKADSGPSSQQGFWLEQMYPRYSVEDIAEYVVGLLFAAHKNPAIGAAQAYLMLHEHCTEEDRLVVADDAKNLLSYTSESMENNAGEEMAWNTKFTSLRRLCLETLRLTAHSIGAVRTAQEDFAIEVVVAEDDHDEDDEQTGVPSKELSPLKETYVVPKGASIALTHIAPSRNPQLWGDKASQFDFKAHSILNYQDEYKFTTFSHGVHKCPGQQLAVVILQCTVALLVEDYDITLPSKIPPLSFERATLAQREGPVWVEITPATRPDNNNDNEKKKSSDDKP